MQILKRKLDRWLAKPGNTRSKLADRMGYESTSTISQWFSRGDIPPKKKAQFIEIMKEV